MPYRLFISAGSYLAAKNRSSLEGSCSERQRQWLRTIGRLAASDRVAEFLAKLGTVVEEADETVFWLELLSEAEVVPGSVLADVASEARQLLAIFAASQLTVKRSLQEKS